MIVQCITNTFKEDIIKGIQQPQSQNFYLALFTESAELNKNTTSYHNTTNEVAEGNGYITGGKKLEGEIITLDNDTAILDFADLVWENSSITAKGALIYNETLAGRNSVGILDFGTNYTSNNGDFKIIFPDATETTGFIRLV